MGTADYFSYSQHHSRVDVQLTTQFSAFFQRGLVEAGVSQNVNVAGSLLLIVRYLLVAFEIL